jgi:LPXTG-site transpeptidase (sortase) family protein
MPAFLKSTWFISALSGGLIGICLIWLSLTYIPVFIVEIQYQSFVIVKNIYGVTDLRELVLPQFSALDLHGASKYQAYGITIPSLNLDEPVIFNVDPNNKLAYSAALKQGIAHASGTAFPDSPGLGYYFAHSSSPELRTQFNAVFYLLGKLETSDDIYIWHDQEKYAYRVTEKRVTSPDDVSFLQTPPDTEKIVLQTCWPPGTTSQRLLVFAERVER